MICKTNIIYIDMEISSSQGVQHVERISWSAGCIPTRQSMTPFEHCTQPEPIWISRCHKSNQPLARIWQHQLGKLVDSSIGLTVIHLWTTNCHWTVLTKRNLRTKTNHNPYLHIIQYFGVVSLAYAPHSMSLQHHAFLHLHISFPHLSVSLLQLLEQVFAFRKRPWPEWRLTTPILVVNWLVYLVIAWSFSFNPRLGANLVSWVPVVAPWDTSPRPEHNDAMLASPGFNNLDLSNSIGTNKPCSFKS